MEIQIPQNKVGKKSSLFNLVLRFLTSDAMEEKDDQGETIMVKLGGDLTKMLQDRGEPSVVVKREDIAVAEGSEASRGSGTTEVKVVKIGKEFKITGGTVGGGEGCLDYMSLSYQMQEGKAVKHTFKEIKGGVIRAIKAGSSLRRYLEGRSDITEENFIKVLRTHYNVKDSATTFNEMSNTVQEPTETEMNYTLRMMDLRNNVLTLSREEACPFEENLVRRRFFHSLSVGFRYHPD